MISLQYLFLWHKKKILRDLIWKYEQIDAPSLKHCLENGEFIQLVLMNILNPSFQSLHKSFINISTFSYI